MESRDSKDRQMYLERALRAADWFVNTQIGGDRAEWNGDWGRFLYYYYMPERKHIPGLNWTMGRALFVLSEAYSITGKDSYRQAAEMGARYIAALQVMDSHYETIYGVIKERVPQGSFCGALDGAQAASGLLMLAQATKNDDYLRRGKSFCDYILRHFDPEKGMPSSADMYPEETVEYGTGFGLASIGQCTAIPLWHLYRRTGEKKYLEPVIWGADFICSCQKDDGSITYIPDPSQTEPPHPNHHFGLGEGDERYLLRNDDGIVVVILAAYMATEESRYLDAAVAYADWIRDNEPHERPFCAFPVQANNLLDIGRAAGKDYSDWVLDNLDKHLLSLQVTDSDDPRALGGFRGEDEEGDGGIFGGTSLDYVVTRVTCYAAGTLFRLSGKGTGAGFSPFGMETE